MTVELNFQIDPYKRQLTFRTYHIEILKQWGMAMTH